MEGESNFAVRAASCVVVEQSEQGASGANRVLSSFSESHAAFTARFSANSQAPTARDAHPTQNFNISRVRDVDVVGFWQHAGFVSPASFRAVLAEPVTTVDSAVACGSRCSLLENCDAFSFKKEGGACALLQREGAWVPLCPSNKTYCEAGAIDLRGAGA